MTFLCLNNLRPGTLLVLLLSCSICLNGKPITKKEGNFQLSGKPLFTENKGQVIDMKGHTRNDILFTSSVSNTRIYLRKTGISYVFYETPGTPRKVKSFLDDSLQKAGKNKREINGYRLDVNFLNCNTHASVKTEYSADAYTNYYLPVCPDGLLNIQSFERITYQDIYPGIDLVFYQGEKGLEYDFKVRAAGDPNAILLKYDGADRLAITESGDLKVIFKAGSIVEKAPVTFDENLKILKSSFVLDPKTQNISFEVSNYHHQPITIDPSVQWSTYLGGSGDDYISVLTVDKDSNVSGVGTTSSPDFPVSPGAFQSVLGSTTAINLVAVKFNSGGKLLWSTYFGGSANDAIGYSIGSFTGNGPGIASDKSGNIVITSGTNSIDVPVSTGAFQTKNLGGADALIAKFNATGKRVWATYFGDPNNATEGESIAIDNAGSIYITGFLTGKGNLQKSDTTNGHNPAKGLAVKIFIAKFTPAGARSWSLKYGGSKNSTSSPTIFDYPADINVDDSNNIIVVGDFSAADFPFTRVDYTLNNPFGNNTFILKFDSAGKRKWAITAGSNAWMIDVAADKHGNIYTVGYHMGFQAIKNPYQPIAGGGTDGFLAKFDGNSHLLWGTSFGGSANDDADGVVADSNENVAISGVTGSTDFPVKKAIQSKYGGGSGDGFIAKFDKSGGLVWSTYYGGSGLDNPTDIEQDSRGNYYFCGLLQSTDFPIKNAFQDTFSAIQDGFITKILDCTNLYSDVAVSKTNLCFGDTVVLTADSGFSTYKWNTGDTTRSIKAFKPGSYSAAISYKAGCGGSTKIVTLSFSPVPISGIQPGGPLVFCPGDSVSLQATGVYPKYLWSTGDTTFKITAKTSGKYKLTTFNKSGCNISDSVKVTLLKEAHPVITGTNNFSLCKTGFVVLDAGAGYLNYRWSTGDITQKITVKKIDSFQVSVDSAGACGGTSAWVHTGSLPVKIAANAPPFLCNGDSLTLDAGFGFTKYLWNTGETTRLIKVWKTGYYNVTAQSADGCTDTASPIFVLIYPAPLKPVITQDGANLVTALGKNIHYQWLKDGIFLTGETKPKLDNALAGRYVVKTIDSNGCISYSDSFIIGTEYFKIYPNPTPNQLHIEAQINASSDYWYVLTDLLGREIENFDDGTHTGHYHKILSLSRLAQAVYILKVRIGDKVYINKIVKNGSEY